MSFYGYFRKLLVISILSLAPLVASGQDVPRVAAGRLLPTSVGDFRADGKPATAAEPQVSQHIVDAASRSYVSKNGAKYSVSLELTNSDAAAYSLLTRRRTELAESLGTTAAAAGTDAFTYRDGSINNLMFFKGKALVSVRDDINSQDIDELRKFSSALAENLDKGEAEIPALVKHLPGWPGVENRTLYLLNHAEVREAFSNQSVLDALNYVTGTDAAVGNYKGGAKLLLIEFKTPQLATDNDQRIVARLQELRTSGQAVPAAYRRVGNYSVFVFDAANEQAANNLIDQVQYQQVVQWLGRNPNLYDKAVNDFTRTTLGVFVAVVKASGLVIIGSLAVGGLLGALLFRMRRKQQRLAQAYSDAGGMLRLNIDELNATHDPARLLGPRT
ncbi:MAG TPA: hypothetical protein VJV03_00350 [Pyrinomonadaceae bacterium]|nr:hypothetical protein [Pyrinomonadaceae bacterium]